MLSKEEIERLLRDYVEVAPLSDELIDAILAKAPHVEMSEAFRERALKAMAEAQRIRELKQSLITKRGGKYR